MAQGERKKEETGLKGQRSMLENEALGFF